MSTTSRSITVDGDTALPLSRPSSPGSTSPGAAAAGPVLRDAAEATSQAASAAVEQMQEIDWGDVDPGCSYNLSLIHI